MPKGGPERSGVRQVNRFIYRRIGEVLAQRQPGEILEYANSPIARTIDARVSAMTQIGIGEQRIRVVSSIVQIDLAQGLETIRNSTVEDFGAEAA